MKLSRRQLRSLIKEAIEDLGYFDQGAVSTALRMFPTSPEDHRQAMKNFINNTLDITSDKLNAIKNLKPSQKKDLTDALDAYDNNKHELYKDIHSLIRKFEEKLKEFKII